MSARYRRCFAIFVLILTGVIAAPWAFAETTYSFNLPEQSLADSLRAIGQQTEMNILFEPDAVKNVRSPALRGQYTVDEAIRIMLAGTKLEAQHTAANNVVIKVKSSRSTVLPATSVDAPGNSATRVAQSNLGSPQSQSAAGPQDANTPNSTSELSKKEGLEEIVVTAQKRAENAQNVPSSVSVVGKELLDSLHATQLTDVGAYVPGLQIVSGGTPGQTTIIIRGVAPLGPGATVGTYINDTPVGGSSGYSRNTNFALDLLPYDVQRMEVLRGPQGTLYGASTMGGLLKYVLTEPDVSDFHSRVGIDGFGVEGAGQMGGGVRAMVNAPLVPEKLAMIASYALERTPGFIDSVQSGAQDQNLVIQQSARLSLLWQSTDKLSVSLGALYQRIDADGAGEVALTPTNPTPQPVAGDLKDNNYFPQPFYKRISYESATVNWDLNWATFVSATSYAQTLTAQTQDVTRTYGVLYPLFGQPAGLSAFLIQLGLHKFTQELRLASPSGNKFEWLVGTFYTNESSSNEQLLTAQQFSGAPVPGLDPLFVGSIPSTYKEYAGFGDATLHLTDRFEIGAGVRYAKNKQTFRQTSSGSLVTPADNPGSSSEGVWTYSANSSYHFSKDTMLYGRIASGYQPGGPNVVLPNVPPTYQSSTLTNYEVGLKSQFWDRRALIDVAAFRINWSNVQIAATNTQGFSFFTNGGTARSQGVEANSSLQVTDKLVLSATGAYDDATLTADAPSVGGLSGDRLPNIPKWSGSLRADYTQPVSGEWKVRTGAGLRLVGDRLSAVTHSQYSFRLPSYYAVDLDAALSNDRWTMRLFVKNLTDERAYLGYAILTNALTGQASQLLGAPLQPRTVGIAVDASF
jgi:iron complex outermembrane receptor protein